MADATFNRVTIRAYKDKELRQLVDGTSQYILPLNPEQYSQNYKVELERSRPSGNAGPTLKFKSTAPEQLQLEFMFDSTGAIKGYPKTGTAREQVNDFLTFVYNIEGGIHQPRFLKINWGSNNFTQHPHGFDCIVSNLDIKYILFDRSGEALRAKVNATFLRYFEQKKEMKIADRESPDLTHVRTVKDGDRLPLMTYVMYADQSFYLKVARANNLTSFRKLKPSTELFFPPIEKSV